MTTRRTPPVVVGYTAGQAASGRWWVTCPRPACTFYRGGLTKAQAKRPRVYRQGASTYVIGTDDAHVACAALGITAETHQWGATLFGNYARRQGLWRAVNEFRPPKDCKPGVVFVGTIRPYRQTDAEGDPHE